MNIKNKLLVGGASLALITGTLIGSMAIGTTFSSSITSSNENVRDLEQVTATLGQKEITHSDSEGWYASWDLSSYLDEGETIEYITFNDSTFNLKYSIDFKNIGFAGVVDWSHKYFWTNDGPGDNNGHSGWNEIDKDGKDPKITIWDGDVSSDHKVMGYENYKTITNTDDVVNYDEYWDDSWGTNPDTSGYFWSKMVIQSKITSSNKLYLTFDDVSGKIRHDNDDEIPYIGEFDITIYKTKSLLKNETLKGQHFDNLYVENSNETYTQYHDITWKIDTSDFESVDSIIFMDDKINMWYGTAWKCYTKAGTTFWADKYAWTNDGPGDNVGNSGWNEAEKDGRIYYSASSIPADNQFHQIVNTDVYTGYDQYQDTGWMFAGDGSESGYKWGTLTVSAKFNLETSELTFRFSDEGGIYWQDPFGVFNLKNKNPKIDDVNIQIKGIEKIN